MLVYISSMPSVQHQDSNNLRWLQNIIDETMKEKMAMQNLHKEKAVKPKPKAEEDPFWFITTTSTQDYSETVTSSYFVTNKDQPESGSLDDRNKFSQPFRTDISNWVNTESHSEDLDKISDGTSSTVSTTWHPFQIEKPVMNHAFVKNQLKKFGLQVFDESTSTTSTSTTPPTVPVKDQLGKNRIQVLNDEIFSTADMNKNKINQQAAPGIIEENFSKDRFDTINTDILAKSNSVLGLKANLDRLSQHKSDSLGNAVRDDHGSDKTNIENNFNLVAEKHTDPVPDTYKSNIANVPQTDNGKALRNKNNEISDKVLIQKNQDIRTTSKMDSDTNVINRGQAYGLINDLSKIKNSRIDFCKKDVSNKAQPGRCIPLQTLTSVVKLCTHPLSEDYGISSSLLQRASWEFTVARDVQVALLKEPTAGLIDIGAGVGVFSILAASLKRPVVAVEPYMPHIRLLQQSIAVNHLQGYIGLICNAVSDIHETLEAEPVPGHLTQVIWNYVPDESTQYRGENIVETITLDDLMEVINLTSAVLKLDVPKYDNKILGAASRLFGRINITYVFMHWSGRPQLDLQGIADFFVKRNYRALERLNGKELNVTTLYHSDIANVVWEKTKPKITHLMYHVK